MANQINLRLSDFIESFVVSLFAAVFLTTVFDNLLIIKSWFYIWLFIFVIHTENPPVTLLIINTYLNNLK